MENKAENQFIKQIEAFLGVYLDDYGRRRVLGYLTEYRENLEAPMPKKEIIQVVKDVRRMPVTDSLIEEQAKMLCKDIGLDYDLFRNTEKATAAVSEARRSFCKFMVYEHGVSRSRLVKFFNVKASSITRYINGWDRLPPRIKITA